MSTNYIAPTWRMPRNANNTPVDKLSDYSIDLDGADYIDCGDNDMLSFGNGSSDSPFTVSSYIYAEGSSTFPFFDKYPDAGTWALREYRMEVFGTDQVVLIIYDPTPFAGRHEIYSDSLITRDQWQHVVITYDGRGGADAGNGVKIYINGSESTTTIVSYNTYVAMENTTTPVRIGRAGGTYADGKISQCCVFDYVLSENQRTYLNALNNPMAIDGSEPIAYWPLGDNANPIATAGYPNISVGTDSVFDFESGSTTFVKAFDVPVTTFTECTFSAWVNFETVTGTYQYVMGMGSGPGNFMSISKNQNSGTWYTYDGTGSDYTASSPVANRWYHVVVTQTGTTRRFYIDGVEDANSPFTVQALAIPYDNLTLGCYNNSSSSTPSVLYKLDGKLSNVQVWDKKIEQTDVTTLYNDGQPLMTGTQPEEANLRAWYKLNQSANWEADSVGNWQIPDAVSAFPQCFEFDGIADKVTIPKGSITDTGSKSVSIWIKNEITSGTDYVFNSRAGGGTSLGITLIQTTTAGYIISNSHNPLHSSHIATDYQTALRIPNDGKWHHLVWTAFPTLQKLKAYIDGVFVYEYTGDTTIDTTPSTDITVGATTSPWTGKLSNFQIWDDVVLSDGGVALNDTATGQIAELFNNGTPLTTAIESSNMKVWCKFDSTAVWYPASGIWGFPSAVEPGSPIVNFSN